MLVYLGGQGRGCLSLFEGAAACFKMQLDSNCYLFLLNQLSLD